MVDGLFYTEFLTKMVILIGTVDVIVEQKKM